jgi:hypothetical protein
MPDEAGLEAGKKDFSARVSVDTYVKAFAPAIFADSW